MKCPECGLKQVPETARFCPQCGAAIPEESRPSTQIQAQVHVREVRDHAKATALEIGKVEGSVSIVQEARPKEHPRVRHQVLERVRRTWLEAEPAGLLHGAVSVEPGLVPRPDLVEHPRGVPYAGISVEVLPTHTAIADVFTQAGGSLLIVGAPGSGKKGRLLELTHVLIERAAEDADEPMPVVLYLSTWSGDLPGEGQASADRFARWLADELSEIYTGALGTRLCKEWLENRRLVLLLYGLDQVGQEHQETCIRAINHFVKEYGPVEIVVCSNTRDYEALKARLRMQGAVELQSLTDGQVDDYLANAGPGAATLRAALQSDEALRELARSPLYLGLMLDIYRGQPVEAAQALSTIEARRADLWHDYVERTFERESASNERRYTQEQTTGWLAWLAHVMKQRGQALFMLERMQPDWLSPAAQRLHAISTGLIVVLAVGLPASLAVYFLTGVLLQERAFLRYGPYYGKIVGPVFGLALGLSAWLIAKRTFGLASVLAVGVSFGAAMAIGVAKVFDPVTGVIAGAVFGSVFMALFVAYSRQRSSGRTSAAQIQTIEIKKQKHLRKPLDLIHSTGPISGEGLSLHSGY